MNSKQLSELEHQSCSAIVNLIKEIKEISPLKSIEIIDSVIKSSSICKHSPNFVKVAMLLLAKNARLDQAKELGTEYLSACQLRGVAIPIKFKAEYEEICLHCENRLSTFEPSSAYYNSIYRNSAEYKKPPGDSVYANVWKIVVNHIQKMSNSQPVNLLDIGCGPGQFAGYLYQETSDINYRGIDISLTAIMQAKKSAPNCEFICSSLDKLDQQTLDETDIFLSLEVLEHIVEDINLIKQLPSGRPFLFSVPNFDSFSHMRYFKNSSEILNRYKHYFEGFSVKPVNLDSTKSSSVIYVCQGKTL